jgi:23S rRNA (guanine745-N1)-methyltransferase
LLHARPVADGYGDTREMLKARRRFLNAGHFAPLVKALSETTVAYLTANVNKHGSGYVLDSGCGEGHYLAQLASILAQASSDYQPCYFGIDISKAAARLASAHRRNLNFIVSDIRSTIPLASNAAVLILNVFAPRNIGEFTRLTAPGGLLAIVIPTLDHLAELRQRYELRGLGIREQKEAAIITELSTTFELHLRHNVRFQLHLCAQGIRDLVAMTPAARHIAEPDLERIAKARPLSVTAAFTLLFFEKRGR